MILASSRQISVKAFMLALWPPAIVLSFFNYSGGAIHKLRRFTRSEGSLILDNLVHKPNEIKWKWGTEGGVQFFLVTTSFMDDPKRRLNCDDKCGDRPEAMSICTRRWSDDHQGAGPAEAGRGGHPPLSKVFDIIEAKTSFLKLPSITTCNPKFLDIPSALKRSTVSSWEWGWWRSPS